SPYGLAESIGIEEKEAQSYISNYFSTHPRIKKFIDKTLQNARVRGFVSTLMGRKRQIPNINSDNSTLRLQAEREAINTPIQGSAAEVMKIAMIKIHHRLKERRLNAKMLLQIHDELLFEVPHDEKELTGTIVKKCMEEAVSLNVSLKALLKTGKNWFEAH
ncbi:MAG TPA: DNA polymerase I, partial [Candidatus Omnitrophica bacterium]|nr:DNA polymerase I [Candidatus Omnitrophota bacterium]